MKIRFTPRVWKPLDEVMAAADVGMLVAMWVIVGRRKLYDRERARRKAGAFHERAAVALGWRDCVRANIADMFTLDQYDTLVTATHTAIHSFDVEVLDGIWPSDVTYWESLLSAVFVELRAAPYPYDTLVTATQHTIQVQDAAPGPRLGRGGVGAPVTSVVKSDGAAD